MDKLLVNLIIVLVTIIFSIIIVRIGAIALRLTGMSWDNAMFQSVSAFTGAGYTTEISENILKNEKRQQVIVWMIVLGNAGFATILVTLLKNSGVGFNIESFNEIINLILIVILCIILYLIVFRNATVKDLNRLFEKILSASHKFKDNSIEEVLYSEEGYGFARLKITEKSNVCGKKLSDINLEKYKVIIVAVRITKGDKFIPAPKGDLIIEPSCVLICYGNVENIIDFFIKGIKETI